VAVSYGAVAPSSIHPDFGWAKLATLVEGAKLASGRIWNH
jgi:hypothetical protein